MGVEWHKLLRGRDFDLGADSVLVRLGERSQKLTITDEEDHLVLSAVVARAKVVRQLDDLLLRVWKRNRATQLVGFRIDSRDRLVAESVVVKAGLTAEEFQLYARTVARESDRFEFELTGKNVE